MSTHIQDNELASFHLPRYRDIPDIGLLLEQTVRLVNGYMEPLGTPGLTPSMVSNYVKQDIIARAVKKQYGREQIAYLVFIAVAKTVLALDDIQLLIDKQKVKWPLETAYDRFCDELEQALAASSDDDPLPTVEDDLLSDILHDIAAAASMSIALRMKLEALT